jgi:E3 ubiquitin-protein ligase HUWE1
MLTDVILALVLAETTSEYVDALFTFLTYLQTAVAAGNMLQGAGVVPLLVDLVKETKLSHDALLVANRAVTFLDNFTYSFPNASGPFATAGGLQVFVQRVQQLVTSGVSASKEHASQGKKDINSLVHAGDPGTLSYGETTLLKSLFRCLQRLMNSGQNTEGVRQLIDSSLVESCKLVMEHRDAFGPQNLALAVTIMLTFVHNEPTSLTVLQENKVPDVFYDTIKGEVEPSLDVLSVIPTAIGALCLNEAGLKQFTDQCSDVFNKYFGTFLSEKHARILNERENAVIIGANFDELVRHHPSLKPAVLDAITKLLKDLYDQGKDYSPEHAESYRLVQVKPDDGIKAATATPPVGTNQASGGESVGDSMMSGQSTDLGDSTPDAESKRDDNRMLASVAVVGRVSLSCRHTCRAKLSLPYSFLKDFLLRLLIARTTSRRTVLTISYGCLHFHVFHSTCTTIRPTLV